jgi:hypothetical protein
LIDSSQTVAALTWTIEEGSTERGQDLLRKRLFEIGADTDPPFEPSGPAGLDGHSDQLGDRPAALRDDDLFSLGDSVEELGEVGLGFVYVEDFHGISLAKLVYSGYPRAVEPRSAGEN